MYTQDPIFVVGCQRSGTTMFRLMLTAHPNIGIPPEGDFIPNFKDKYSNLNKVTEKTYTDFIEDIWQVELFSEWGLDKKELLEFFKKESPKNYEQFVELVYRFYNIKTFPGAKRWGDKKPDYVLYFKLLEKMFPKAQFIHLIRDGRDVALSWIKAPFGPEDTVTAALRWVQSVDYGNKNCRKFKKKSLEVRYEDLLETPEAKLSEITEFLGEKFDSKMLEYYKENESKELVPDRQMQWHKNTTKPVKKDRMFVWKKQMSFIERLKFEAVAAKTLKRNKYEVLPLPIRLLGKILLIPQRKKINEFYSKNS